MKKSKNIIDSRSKSIGRNYVFDISAVFATIMVVLNILVAVGAFVIIGSNGSSKLNNKVNATYGYMLAKNSKSLLQCIDNDSKKSEKLLNWFNDRDLLVLIVSDDKVIYNSTEKSSDDFFKIVDSIISANPENQYTTGLQITKNGTIAISQSTVNSENRRAFVIDENFTYDSLDTETINLVLLVIGLMAALDIACLFLVVIGRYIYMSNVRKKMVEPLIKLQIYVDEILDGYYDNKIEYEFDNEIGDIYNSVERIRLLIKGYVTDRMNNLDSKRMVVSGIMHDIATPITRINGCASMIRDGMVNDEETIKKMTETILMNTEDINILLKRLAEIARYNETAIKTHMMPVNVSHLVKEYCEKIAPEIARMDADIEFVDNCDHAPICKIDVKSCKRVLVNVIFNSIKYRKPNEHCHGRLELNYDERGDLVLSFADNGKGIAPGTENRIFEMFYREDNSRTAANKGNGIGLFVSREIVLSNKGKIWAKNNEEGLTVYVTLPTTDEPPVEWN